MKLYIEVQLATDDDMTVRRAKLEGVTGSENFNRLTRIIEGAMRHDAREVVVDRDRLGVRVA